MKALVRNMVSSQCPVLNKNEKQLYLSISPSSSVLKDNVELDFSDVFGPLPEEASDVVFDEPAVVYSRSHSLVGPSLLSSHSFKLSKLTLRETKDSVDLVECLEGESLKETDESSGNDDTDSEKAAEGDLVKVSGVVGIEDFEVMKVVGKGAFGKVYQVRKKETSEIYAMKVMRKDQIMEKNHAEYMKAERDILTKIDHPFIVQLKYSFQVKIPLLSVNILLILLYKRLT